jgi:hypothetical protein
VLTWLPTLDSPVSSSWKDTPLLYWPVRVVSERCQSARMLQQAPRYWKPAKSSMDWGAIGTGVALGALNNEYTARA